MKCPQCGDEINDNSKFCGSCGCKIDVNAQTDISVDFANLNEKGNILPSSNDTQASLGEARISGENGKNVKVPFYFQMWFIALVVWGGSFVFCLGPITAIVLFVLRLVKYPNNRKTALISAGIQIALVFSITAWAVWDSGKDDRAINNLLNEGKYTEAIEYVETNFDSTSYEYYKRIAEIYEKQGDYDSAASYVLKYTEIVSDIADINDNVVSKLKTYKGKITNENEQTIDERIDDIAKAKEEKEATEKKAAEEKAAKEA